MFNGIRVISLLTTLATLAACTTLDTKVSVATAELPSSFREQPSYAGNTIANINWRDFFADGHLRNLIDTAVRNNVDLQIALQRIEIARTDIRAAGAVLLPQVNLSVGGGVRKFGLYTMDGAGNATTDIRPGERVPVNLTDIFVGLQTSWELDIWGKLRNQRKAVIASYLSSIEATNFIITNLVADVATYYNELVALDSELEIIEQTIQKQHDALEVVQWQMVAGRATQLAVQQFTAQLLAAQALESNVRQQITENENKLNFLLGQFPKSVVRDKATFLQLVPDSIAAGLPSELLANRPDVRQAEHLVQASAYDVKAAKALFFPQFTITGHLGFQAFNSDFLFVAPASLAYSAMGNLVMPIVNRAGLKARFATAKSNQITAMYHYQKTILNAYMEVANQLANLRNLREFSDRKRRQTELLRQAVETSEELYKSGRASYLEVLVAQQNALQANLELVDAVKKQRLAKITIYKALGGGWK